MPRLYEGISPKFSSAVHQKCSSLGIKTVLDFVVKDPEDLAEKIKVPYKDVLSIHNDLLLNFGSLSQNAVSLQLELLESLSVLSTGSKRLNTLLHGGIYTGEITEVQGLPASGKTQFCMSVVATLISETRNTVLYLDTRGNFSALRLEEIILEKCDKDQAVISKLLNVKVISVYNIFGLFDCLEELRKKFTEQDSAFARFLKLVIVDAATPLISPCFGKQFSRGPGTINNLSEMLHYLCLEYKLSVILCNDSVRGDDGGSPKAALGLNWKYVPSVSICLGATAEGRTATLTKSSRTGLHGEASFQISRAGIVDC